MTTFKGNRKFPNPITVTDDPRSHTLALQQVIEALNIGQRRTKEIQSSYVRVHELVDVGLIEIVGNQLKLTNLGQSVAAGTTALDDLSDVVITAPASGDELTFNGTEWVNTAPAAAVTRRRSLGAVWGSSSALVAADCADVFVHVPEDGTIVSAKVYTQGGNGSCVVDVWKDTYANFPPTNADSITAAAPPTVTAAAKSSDTTLTGWTTAVSRGDVLVFHVDSTSTFTNIVVVLEVEY